MAWFQQVVVTHRKTRFFIKADWDTWIHTTRLEVNLRMLSNRSEPLYFGNTLWCSYAPADYQPCGYGFGPLQAAGARTTECPALPRGVSGRGPGSGAVGPFPYTAGLFWGVSYELVRWMARTRWRALCCHHTRLASRGPPHPHQVRWMAGSRLVYDFTHNASARFRPPYWVKGEDSSFGFLYAAPQPCHSRAVRCRHSPATALPQPCEAASECRRARRRLSACDRRGAASTSRRSRR